MAFCAFVAFNNLSLQYNDVSFYQLMKILTTPAVVVLQLVFFKVCVCFATLRREVAFSFPLSIGTAHVPVDTTGL